jgi:hypothetical protein
MNDYKSAFSEGLKAAERANAARKEIDQVFKDLNTQLSDITEGRIHVIREQRARNSTLKLVITLEPDYYWAIIAYNPKVGSSPNKELCEWEMGSAGYPCKMIWSGNTHYCENKQALEATLSVLLKDAIIAEKFWFLMNYQAENKK